jgi:hypothetical protein
MRDEARVSSLNTLESSRTWLVGKGVFSEYIGKFQNVARRLNVLRVELVKFSDILQDIIQLRAKNRTLLLREREP